MPRMLGRYRKGGCWSGTPSDHRTHPDGGGLDCAGHERDTRWRKRVEARQWLAAEGLWPLPLLPAPYTDESDCRHGCNGDEVVNGHESEACDWQCHPGLVMDPERAARFDAIMAGMETIYPADS